MTGYAAERASALRDLTDAGTAVTFSLAGGTYTFATDVTSSATSGTVSGYAIRVKGNPIKYQALSLVQSESPTLLFAPTTAGQVPALESSVTWGGVSYIARDVEPVDPDGRGAIVYRVIIGR